MNNTRKKNIIKFMETELGRKLTKKEIRQAVKQNAEIVAYKQKLINTEKVMQFRASGLNQLSWRYGGIAVASFTLCLLIMLPFSLGKPKTLLVPEYIYINDGKDDNKGQTYPDNKHYNPSDIFFAPISEDRLRNIDNLLLLDKNSMYFFDAQMEFAATEVYNPVVLGYYISKALAVSSEDQLSWFTQRIRTHKNYQFAGYYQYFSTLEETHKQKAEGLSSDEVFEVDIVYEKNITFLTFETIEINAFVIDNIKVFTHRLPSIENDKTQVYFIYEGNEYFIEIQDLDFEVNIDYIKNDFMPTLLSNAAGE